jgi:hypothetical protein
MTGVEFALVTQDSRGRPDIDQGITGKMGRKSLKVIGSVGGAIKAFVQKYSPEFLSLSSTEHEGSRVSLYQKLAPKLAKQLGWKGSMEVPEIGFVTQILYKDKPLKKKKRKKAPAMAESAAAVEVMTEEACGDCFRWAGKRIIHEPPHVKLAHGMVSPTWHGGTYAHAWLETKKKVYDWQTMTPEAEMARTIWPDKYQKYAGRGWPRATFYKVFKPKKVTLYDEREAVQTMVKNMHWGPWT